MPKGPFRTKNSTALESVLFATAVVLQYPYRFPVIFLHVYRICSPYRNSLSAVFLVREGPLGKLTWQFSSVWRLILIFKVISYKQPQKILRETECTKCRDFSAIAIAIFGRK